MYTLNVTKDIKKMLVNEIREHKIHLSITCKKEKQKISKTVKNNYLSIKTFLKPKTC